MKVVISREYGNIQTLGTLVVFDGKEILLKVLTLELPDLGNQKSISCIPEGKYAVHRIYSPKFHNCYIRRTVLLSLSIKAITRKILMAASLSE